MEDLRSALTPERLPSPSSSVLTSVVRTFGSARNFAWPAVSALVVAAIAFGALMGLACAGWDGPAEVPTGMWTEAQAESITTIRGMAVQWARRPATGASRALPARGSPTTRSTRSQSRTSCDRSAHTAATRRSTRCRTSTSTRSRFRERRLPGAGRFTACSRSGRSTRLRKTRPCGPSLQFALEIIDQQLASVEDRLDAIDERLGDLAWGLT